MARPGCEGASSRGAARPIRRALGATRVRAVGTAGPPPLGRSRVGGYTHNGGAASYASGPLDATVASKAAAAAAAGASATAATTAEAAAAAAATATAAAAAAARPSPAVASARATAAICRSSGVSGAPAATYTEPTLTFTAASPSPSIAATADRAGFAIRPLADGAALAAATTAAATAALAALADAAVPAPPARCPLSRDRPVDDRVTAGPLWPLERGSVRQWRKRSVVVVAGQVQERRLGLARAGPNMGAARARAAQRRTRALLTLTDPGSVHTTVATHRS